MLFEDVDAYARYVVRLLDFSGKLGAGRDVCDVAEFCARTYSRVEEYPEHGFCVSGGAELSRGYCGRLKVCGTGTSFGSLGSGAELVVGESSPVESSECEGGTRSRACVDDSDGGTAGEGNVRRVGVSSVDDAATRLSGSVVGETSDARGSNYWRNKRKRENKKRKMQCDWRSNSGCQKEDAKSDATVVTVDTKTAEEVQAKRSLAVRRTMENKVATALAAHKLRTLKDKSRTDAVERLAAARFEQRINEAKAKSQSSFKQCDQSLKSLGSSGSAGEFALKQEVKRAQDDRKLLDYVQKQLDIAIKCATPAAIAAINALPAPEFQDEFEAFGDCPSDYDEDEAQAYYNQLNIRNQELADIANVGF